MGYHTHDTIAAVASAPGGAARGIVRLGGPNVGAILARLFEPANQLPDSDSPAVVISGSVRLAGSRGDSRLPVDLYYWPGRRSYTREPLAEFHSLGSPPLLAALVESLSAAGARVAEPGEFTLRAFLAGRLDLTQAEAVLGVIDANSQHQFDAALAQLAGGLSRPLAAVRESLLDLLAELEAGLDFAEEDLEFITRERLAAQLERAQSQLQSLMAQMQSRAAPVDAVRIVLVGLPNVGKSSLFNALCTQSAALVSPQAGTTRDFLRAAIDFGGLTCELIDTAGVQTIEGGIAAAAQTLSDEQAAQADVRVLCLDASRALHAWELQQLTDATFAPTVIVVTKSDLPRRLPAMDAAISTSVHTGLGIGQLREKLQELAAANAGADDATLLSTAARCGESLRRASDALAEAQSLAAGVGAEELIAADVRAALDELGRVVGAIFTDDILDRVFSRFCIGK